MPSASPEHHISLSPPPTLPEASSLRPSHKNPTNLTMVAVFGISKGFVVVGF
jgi:hypothetical protein